MNNMYGKVMSIRNATQDEIKAFMSGAQCGNTFLCVDTLVWDCHGVSKYVVYQKTDVPFDNDLSHYMVLAVQDFLTLMDMGGYRNKKIVIRDGRHFEFDGD